MAQNAPLPPEPEKEQGDVLTDLPVRVFSFPQEFRGMSAQLASGDASQENTPPPTPDPIFVPMPFPVQQETPAQEPERKRSAVTRVLILLLLLVILGGGGVGAWWYITQLQAPEQPLPPVAVVTPPASVPENPEPSEPYPGTDTDSDGLTNKEELLYGTDFRAPDTDGDTFLDGNEVFHRYDPNGLAPSTLLDTGSVRILERTEMPFTVFYPASWDISLLAESARVSFRSSSTANIVMQWEPKDTLVLLDDWLEDQDISLKNTEASLTKEGYMARNANDGRTAYLDVGAWVVTAEYDVGEGLSIDFLQTFAMMMNSVKQRTLVP